MNKQHIELDISKYGNGKCIKVAQGDVGGTTIEAAIFDNGSELSLDGAKVQIVALLPNKRNYYRDGCQCSGNLATHVLKEDKLCSVPGYTDDVYFTVEIDGKVYSTERFAIEILRSALDGQKPAQSWDDAVQDLINRGESAVSSANSAASSANKAASSANAAAGTASAAAESANAAASKASTAASNADAATGKANTAASSANSAASAASAAKQNADKATDAASKAAGIANSAASSANASASRANGAADDATAAATNALNIANSIASIKPPSDTEVEELRKANEILASAVSELQDKYVLIGETAYVPPTRVTSYSGETLALAQSGISDETATLN